jgi:uncharacterized membrane protein HdeD (DUF308 family)
MEVTMIGTLARNWGWVVLRGVVAILFGVLTLSSPGLTLATLVILFGVAVALRLRAEVRGEWWLALAGVLSVAFGLVLILSPIAGALALALYIGAYAVIAGIVQIAWGFGLRSWGRRHTAGPTPSQA